VKQGILLIDKPEDWTSFDAVNYVRRIIASREGLKPKKIKVGHSGTLDPFATGLLVLLVGKDYTRRASEFTKQDKIYTFELILGKSSTTGDKTGSIKKVSGKKPKNNEVEGTLKQFIGKIKQTPPAFSAIKINGVRAYKLARQGAKPEIEAREVVIHSLDLINYDYPRLTLKTNVSSGTYIRSLGEDIGEVLKTGAYVDVLRRDSVSTFNVKDACSPKQLDQDNVEQFINSA
jgi:tRNA pseudouridine55 synthase